MSGFANKGPQDYAAPPGYASGPTLVDMSLIAGGGGHSYSGAVTAKAGGTRPLATKITAGITRITVCATAADSVSLPPALGGQFLILQNSGAAACQVFADPATADTINGVAAATGVSLAVGKGASFSSPAAGAWFWVLSA